MTHLEIHKALFTKAQPQRDLIFAQEAYRIIGAALEVYNTLGPGFAEAVYQEALVLELTAKAAPFRPQQEIHIDYKGKRLRKTYLADFVAYEAIIIEIKAIQHLSDQEEAQALNYLKATRFKLALLINFGHPKLLDWKRIVH